MAYGVVYPMRRFSAILREPGEGSCIFLVELINQDKIPRRFRSIGLNYKYPIDYVIIEIIPEENVIVLETNGFGDKKITIREIFALYLDIQYVFGIIMIIRPDGIPTDVLNEWKIPRGQYLVDEVREIVVDD